MRDPVPALPIRNDTLSVLIVSGSDVHARIDKTTLRRMRLLYPAMARSGAAALRKLAKEPWDLVLCDQNLEDMSGLDFLRMVRSLPWLAALPVVLASQDSTESSVLDAVGAGCSGYLIRPYSLGSFERQIQRALRRTKVWRATRAQASDLDEADKEAVEQAIKNFTRVLETPDTAELHFERGIRHLASRRYDAAIQCFQKAVALNAAFAEAYLGLARAWKAKGNLNKYREYMRLAMEAFTRQERFLEAREAFAELQKSDPQAKDPNRDAASTLLKRMDFAGAARVYSLLLEGVEDKTGIYAHMARTCHFTEDPRAAALGLSRELAKAEGSPPAQVIYHGIMGPSLDRERELGRSKPRRGNGRLRFLKEVILVAGHTFQVFRQGGAA